MGRFVDMTGERFGRYVVIERVGVDTSGRVKWLCLCDCGVKKQVVGRFLRSGIVVSCGCYRREMVPRNKTHGAARGALHREYESRRALIQRCVNPKDPYFKNYGGRGIRVCDRWRASFEAFLEDMGPKPTPKHTIDRKNNNGHYSCGKCNECAANGWTANCRWITRSGQMRNFRNNRLVTYRGETLCVVEWAERLGMKPNALRTRLNRGWSIEEAMTLAADRVRRVNGKGLLAVRRAS